VHWINQIQGTVSGPTPALTTDNMTKFLAAYDTYMLNRAALLQSLGVDVMSIDCICWFPAQGATTDQYISELASLAPRIKAIYSGKLRMEINTIEQQVYANATLKGALDYVQIVPFPQNISTADIQSLTVETLESLYAAGIASRTNLIDNSKPIIWGVGAPSRPDFFNTSTSGYEEEMFCTAGFGGPGTTPETNCYQQTTVTDFSFQAMVYEAQLEAIQRQSYFQTFSVSAGAYWLGDNILPDTDFPNIAYNIRNKPAEALLYRWFKH
jgi:hypothetical protein